MRYVRRWEEKDGYRVQAPIPSGSDSREPHTDQTAKIRVETLSFLHLINIWISNGLLQEHGRHLRSSHSKRLAPRLHIPNRRVTRNQVPVGVVLRQCCQSYLTSNQTSEGRGRADRFLKQSCALFGQPLMAHMLGAVVVYLKGVVMLMRSLRVNIQEQRMMVYVCLSEVDLAECGNYNFLVIGCLNVDQIRRGDVECRGIGLEQYFELLSAESGMIQMTLICK